MNKTQMLEAMQNAKQIHLAQMEKIDNVLSNKKIDDPTPIGKMECECGKWFYSNEDEIKHVLGSQLFNKLDFVHENWHKQYAKIYDIFFKEEKKGFFAKLLGNKVDDMLVDKAKLYYTELELLTKELLQTTDVATRRISALQESKFK